MVRPEMGSEVVVRHSVVESVGPGLTLLINVDVVISSRSWVVDNGLWGMVLGCRGRVIFRNWCWVKHRER